ncbi:winged helix-turn-helix domain-containing protein [Actinokineospora iranica]|uniref:winged helix-turn-helix domain-containing protein n=1 Tax=Actinokineospora iranica TaxID=1271860 RepID=UPI001587C2D3|nr:winged helix-turn-helix domain-containing protein [Actinokineospora iranica]
MDAVDVFGRFDPPLILCVGTSADELAAVAAATGGRAAVLYLPDTGALRTALAAMPSPRAAAHRVVEHGKLRLDADLREATWRGGAVPLSSREFDLLFALAADPGRVWSFAELTTHVWGRPYVGDTQAVGSAVKRLRRQLREVASEVRVESVRGVGYRLTVGEVPLPSH